MLSNWIITVHCKTDAPELFLLGRALILNTKVQSIFILVKTQKSVSLLDCTSYAFNEAEKQPVIIHHYHPACEQQSICCSWYECVIWLQSSESCQSELKRMENLNEALKRDVTRFEHKAVLEQQVKLHLCILDIFTSICSSCPHFLFEITASAMAIN